jgi:hypothetical protein
MIASNIQKQGGRAISIAVLLLCGVFLAHTSAARAQSTQKVVEGKVVGSNDQPLSEAIVYLKNGKTGDIKSFITTPDGGYRFGQVSGNNDYDLWAAYQGKKSPTKPVSSFDSRKTVNYELKVDTGK